MYYSYINLLGDGETMNLFEVLPERFFSLLTGANKKLYAEAVLLIYEQSQRERFGIRYDVMQDLLQELIETQRDLGIDFELDEEKLPAAERDRNVYQQITLEELSRAQANYMLRRMESLKWIDIEVRDQFQRYIVLPHYTSRMMALFKELCEARAVEYQRFAFSTFQVLSGEEAKLRPCFAIREAREITLQFRQELITLYNNMKHHMEQVVQKTSIQEVLDHHFDTYKSQIVDKSYHRLKTSDHVSRYRFQILQRVQNWWLDRNLFEETINDGLQSDFYKSREEAEGDIRDALLTIEEIYAGLDEIFYRIDVRHNQYLRSSYDRARYLGQHQTGVSQQLATLLEHLTDQEGAFSDRKATAVFTDTEATELGTRLFRLQLHAQLSEGSLYTPRQRRQPHRPEKHVRVDIPQELKEQLREANLERIRRSITRKKVEQFVLERLGNREQMEMRELAPQTVEQFLLLAYVYLYGQDGSSSFCIKRSEERVIVEIGPYRFHNHRIVRSKRKSTR
ncbi:Wadjet anti-phage system protein JetA family protein [Anoxybacteroides rupiense]|uniref:Wadjet anti-phage system protein JetA family protein n=1 Tax=Anoxybacteroides rupiense TaxID=311460 RepID=UPI0023AF5429|nr:Wadjet anti-phage system protein JetA family protein [Anoxybacillus rupiensis]